jgi:hypothetical protein
MPKMFKEFMTSARLRAIREGYAAGSKEERKCMRKYVEKRFARAFGN